MIAVVQPWPGLSAESWVHPRCSTMCNPVHMKRHGLLEVLTAFLRHHSIRFAQLLVYSASFAGMLPHWHHHLQKSQKFTLTVSIIALISLGATFIFGVAFTFTVAFTFISAFMIIVIKEKRSSSAVRPFRVIAQPTAKLHGITHQVGHLDHMSKVR